MYKHIEKSHFLRGKILDEILKICESGKVKYQQLFFGF